MLSDFWLLEKSDSLRDMKVKELSLLLHSSNQAIISRRFASREQVGKHANEHVIGRYAKEQGRKDE
jgi:hypothetical protein